MSELKWMLWEDSSIGFSTREDFPIIGLMGLWGMASGDTSSMDQLREDEEHALELLDDYFTGVSKLNSASTQVNKISACTYHIYD